MQLYNPVLLFCTALPLQSTVDYYMDKLSASGTSGGGEPGFKELNARLEEMTQLMKQERQEKEG